MQILTLYQANATTLTLFIKRDEISITLVKFGTVDRRPDSGRRSARADENVDTVESLLLSQEDKPQSHRTVREISREAGYPLIISFEEYS